MLPKGWNIATLGSIATIERGKFSIRPRNDPNYFGGSMPFVQTGDVANAGMFLRSYTQTLNDRGVSVSKVFGVETILLTIAANIGATAITTFPIACPDSVVGIRPYPEKVDLFWLKYALISQKKNLDYQAGQNAQKNINLEVLKPLRFKVPALFEQQRIGRLLVCWDQAIAITEQLIANSLRQKKLLAQRMLTGKMRLQGFSNGVIRRETPFGSLPADWAYLRIGEVAVEVSEKLGNISPYPVLFCTKHHGLVDSLSYFNKQVFSLDTSNYKIVPQGCFVYATNHIDEGSIGYQNLYDFGLVSPMYTSFKTNDEIFDSYIFALFKTEHYRQIFASATNASVDRRGSLRWKDFRKLHIPVPSISEQKAIANVLMLADRDVDLMQRKLDLLRKEKSALMAQLLTGKRRVHLPDPETAAQA